MLLAFFILVAMPDLVPVRWPSAEAKSLELVSGSAVNCLLVEHVNWSAPFAAKAAFSGVATFGVIHPSPDWAKIAKELVGAHLTGAVLEGSFESEARDGLRKYFADQNVQVVELPPRGQMRFDVPDPIVGTNQGLWPGVQVQDEKNAKAAPSGAAWIDTNSGFLRFARASTKAVIWTGNRPPAAPALPVERYQQAIGDAAMTGARWIVALDDEWNRKLLARDEKTLAGWKRILETLSFYESHKEWRSAEPFARLALVEDEGSGAMLSGGILDMIATKHTPVRPVPPDRLNESVMEGATLAVNVDPESLSAKQKDVLKAFTRSGGTLLTGPPGWKFPKPRQGQITLEKDDLNKLDEIWRELNSLTGRKNLGARLFNVSTMLSNLVERREASQVILHLVNYSDYPVENVTVHVLGQYRSAQLVRPDGPPIPLKGYEVEEGTGYDIDKVGVVAALVLAR